MGKLKPGDRVICKLGSGKVISAYSNEWDEKYTFEIVAFDNKGYYIYVPHYICVKGGLTVNTYNCKSYGIAPKFVGETILYITDNQIISVASKADGLVCDKCREFCAQAETEEDVFVCWSCRTYPPYR